MFPFFPESRPCAHRTLAQDGGAGDGRGGGELIQCSITDPFDIVLFVLNIYSPFLLFSLVNKIIWNK